MLKQRVIVVTASMALSLMQSCVHAPYHELEQSLLRGHAVDTPLELRLGSDFLDVPGTIIFLSRERGVRRLVALARSGAPELSILYLPRWKAWMTETTFRDVGMLRLDKRYVFAALLSEDEVELWHTHNNIEITTPRSDTERRERERQWTMPSTQDLLQLYDYTREVPQTHFRGYIAHIHGVTGYWSDKENWSQPVYIRSALRLEGDILARSVTDVPIADLQQFAKKHDGILRISVELMR